MAFAFSDILYGALAGVFGTEAVFTIDAAPVTITVIDKTRGVEVAGGNDLGIHTLTPAVMLRVADIPSGIEVEDFDGVPLTLDGRGWRVRSIEERPTSAGRADGTAILFLSSTDA